jgi:cellulose synthase operon protein YhjQ
MEKHLNDHPEQPLAPETPEDVAILYSWANLHGAKYRDFSASRREYRAQVRHRAAEELRQAELRAQADAERSALEAERVAREAAWAARTEEGSGNPYPRELAMYEAEEASRRATAERVEAARRAEAAAYAEAIARREEREIAEAHASAQRQAAQWTESEVRRRNLAGPQPSPAVMIPRTDPYVHPQGFGREVDLYTPNEQLERVLPERFRGDDPNNSKATGKPYLPPETPLVRRRPQGFRPDEASGIRPAYGSEQARPRAEYVSEAATAETGPTTPAWLHASPSQSISPQTSTGDTLQDSRERVASQWYGLKGAFDPGQEPAEESIERHREHKTPFLAVFSLAGGVGKTSLVATLGRSLSSLGEKVLLADTTSHGLLPFYFGASELKPGVVRTFSPPSGSSDAPIALVSYDVQESADDRGRQEALANEVAQAASGTHRIVLDLNSSSAWLLRRLSKMSPTILVPVAPDMNSVISLQAVERFFNGMHDLDGRPIQPFYVLNQFDAALPLHLDVREVLRRQLGDRLLPYVIRRSPAVSEALAEGMTVVDYAGDSAVSKDFANVANWLRSVSAPATQAFRNARWSER